MWSSGVPNRNRVLKAPVAPWGPGQLAASSDMQIEGDALSVHARQEAASEVETITTKRNSSTRPRLPEALGSQSGITPNTVEKKEEAEKQERERWPSFSKC